MDSCSVCRWDSSPSDCGMPHAPTAPPPQCSSRRGPQRGRSVGCSRGFPRVHLDPRAAPWPLVARDGRRRDARRRPHASQSLALPADRCLVRLGPSACRVGTNGHSRRARRRFGCRALGGLLQLVSDHPYKSLNALGLVFAMALLAPVWQRLGPAWTVYMLVSLVPPLFAGGLLSMGRLTSTLFPLFPRPRVNAAAASHWGCRGCLRAHARLDRRTVLYMEGDVLAHLPVTSYQPERAEASGGPQHRALFWDGFGGYFRLRGV